jgi:phosphinothricin acetyltransferase
VAVYISPAYRRRNLGKALYTALFEVLRAQGYFKAFAGITLPNAASVRLHESVGFRPIAVYEGVGFKLGQWLDVGWWQLDLQPEIDNPLEPRSLAEVQNDFAADGFRPAERLVQPAPPA